MEVERRAGSWELGKLGRREERMLWSWEVRESGGQAVRKEGRKIGVGKTGGSGPRRPHI